MRVLGLVTLLLGACASSYPCDGSLVRVVPSPAIDYEGHDRVRAGLHRWDAFGCLFRAPDELPQGEVSAYPDIKVIEYTHQAYTYAGEADLYNKVIYFDLDYFHNGWTDVYAENIIAHELGHMLGLGHVPEQYPAIMNPVVNDLDALTVSDYNEFCRHQLCFLP